VQENMKAADIAAKITPEIKVKIEATLGGEHSL
jgi:hypothetical protein